MRLPVVLVVALLLAAGHASAAPEDPLTRTRRPLSGDPPWRTAVLLGAGLEAVNTAGGRHELIRDFQVQAAHRLSPLFTARAVYDYSQLREGGASGFEAVTSYSSIAARADVTLGTRREQFVVGAGPALVVTASRLTDDLAGTSVGGIAYRPALSYGAGLRWMAGSFPMAIDFTGQQRWTRHDFRAVLSFGWPLLATRRAPAEEGKGSMR